MVRLLITVAATILALVCQAPAAAFDKKIAVLIGIGTYAGAENHGKFRDLPSVANDLEIVGRGLRKLGFEIHIYTDQRMPANTLFEPDTSRLNASNSPVAATDVQTAVTSWLISLHQSGLSNLLLVYYTGHGGMRDGIERLLALPQSQRLAANSYYSVTTLISELAGQAPNSTKLLIVDACADNLNMPTRGSAIRQDPGLPGYLFSSSDGEPSYYDTTLNESVFTHYFAEALTRAELRRLDGARRWLDSEGIRRFVEDVVPRHPISETKKDGTDPRTRRSQVPLGSRYRAVVLAEFAAGAESAAAAPEPTAAERALYLRSLQERTYGSKQ